LTEIILKLFILITLMYLSAVDMKTMTVPGWGIGLIYMLGILLFLYGKENINFYLKGWIVLLISSFAIALLTKGLGGGDVKLFSALGASFGVCEALKILALAFVLSGIFICMILTLPIKSKKFSALKSKKEIPFVPFITLSAFLIFTENLLYCL